LKVEDSNKIKRYIAGLSDERERKEIESHFMSENIDSDFKKSLEEDFNAVISETPSDEIKIDHILNSIYHKIHEKDVIERRKPIQQFLNFYMRVAAVLLIPALVAGILFRNHDPASASKTENSELVRSTIFAPLGSRLSFDLPDGTTGMLNSGSSITYSLPFANNRHIDLIGEAWFEVSHDAEHPFIINALNSTIKVLGTSFNLSAYPEENYVELILNRGEVEFLNKSANQKITVHPSERLLLENGKIDRSAIDTSKYNGWINGKLIFRGDPMGEVARRIMRWYNVDIVLSDKQLENYSFRGIFKDDKLEDILTFLAMTSPIEYKIIPRKIMLDGTFRKEKIIISLIKPE
jgi:ferric-dicitrate binding protein FerR (iron transport regulator)